MAALGPTIGYWLAVVVVYGVSVFGHAALATKRPRDRDKPAVPLLSALLGVPFAATLARFVGVGFETVAVPAGGAGGTLNARPIPDSGGMVEFARPDGTLGL